MEDASATHRCGVAGNCGVLVQGIAIGKAVDTSAKTSVLSRFPFDHSWRARGVAQEERTANDDVIIRCVRQATAALAAVQEHSCIEERE